MSFTPAYANTVLIWLFTASSVTRPTSWWVGMHTGTPAADGSTLELSGDGYARQQIAPTVSGSVAGNLAAFTFGPCSGTAWGTVTTLSLWDAQTGGSCISLAPISSQIAYNIGDTAAYEAGAVAFDLS